MTKATQYNYLQNVQSLPWWRIGAALLLLIVCSIASSKLQSKDTLPFARIQVFGDQNNINQQQLNSTILRNINGGFFSLDVQSLQHAVQSLSWVKSVSIRRVWPNTLQVSVAEYKAVARWNDDALIDSHGEIFNADGTGDIPNLVQMSGPQGTHETVISQYNNLQPILQQSQLTIAKIYLNDRRALELQLDNGIRVHLGRVRDELDSSSAIMRFLSAYENGLASRAEEIDEVDLRYTNGLSVTWNPKTARNKNQQHNTSDDQARIG